MLLLLPRIEKPLYNIDCGPVNGYFLIGFSEARVPICCIEIFKKKKNKKLKQRTHYRPADL